MAGQTGRQILFGRADVHVIPLKKGNGSLCADLDVPALRQVHDEHIIAAVVIFPPQHLFGIRQEPDRLRLGKLRRPPQGKGLPVQLRRAFHKRGGKVRIRMVIGQEPAGPVPMDEEQHARMIAVVVHGRQFCNMLPAPFRHGIGKHSSRFSKQGARLDL